MQCVTTWRQRTGKKQLLFLLLYSGLMQKIDASRVPQRLKTAIGQVNFRDMQRGLHCILFSTGRTELCHLLKKVVWILTPSYSEHCLSNGIFSQLRIRVSDSETKILQSIYVAYYADIISSYSNIMSFYALLSLSNAKISVVVNQKWKASV